jgi:hypothetical protein
MKNLVWAIQGCNGACSSLIAVVQAKMNTAFFVNHVDYDTDLMPINLPASGSKWKSFCYR